MRLAIASVTQWEGWAVRGCPRTGKPETEGTSKEVHTNQERYPEVSGPNRTEVRGHCTTLVQDSPPYGPSFVGDSARHQLSSGDGRRLPVFAGCHLADVSNHEAKNPRKLG